MDVPNTCEGENPAVAPKTYTIAHIGTVLIFL